MANTVDKVLKVAKEEVGTLEKSKAAYLKDPSILDKKTEGAGYDNYTKYGRDMHKKFPSVMDFPAPYCDAFVDWCFDKAYGTTTAKSLLGGNFDDYTVASAEMYNKHKAIYTSPVVGDQVFFTKNGSISGCYHTGLVTKVDSTYFYTIEGNTSGASGVVANGGGVAEKKYNISAYRGKVLFGRPKYDAATSSEAPKKQDSKSPKTKVPAIAKPTIKLCSIGTEVEKLQKDLNYLGFKGKNGKTLTVDGDAGVNTIYALTAFQKKYKLQPDGEYGPKSYTKMKEVCK